MINPTMKNVTIQSIHDELRMLWAAEAVTGDAVIRARTHNLIVAVSDNVSPTETTQRVIESTAERPGRVIVLDIEKETDKPLDAWVTTFCRTVNRHQLCGEVITLTVSWNRLADLYSAVTSLLAPDLPVYLWWTGSINLGNTFMSRLAQVSDRVIINLEDCADLSVALPALATVANSYKMGDMAWIRLTTWRKLLAQIWDSPALHPALESIRTLDIHYSSTSEPAHEARAVLLAGWLIDKLGWRIDMASRAQTGGLTVRFTRGQWQGKIEIMETTEEASEPGEIVRIFVQAGSKPPFVMPRLELNAKQSTIETRWNDGATTARRAINTYQVVDDAVALVQELDLGYDLDYQHALHASAAIFESLSRS